MYRDPVTTNEGTRVRSIVCESGLLHMSEPLNHTLFEALSALMQRDSETRQRLLRENRLYGTYDEEMQQVHRDNALALSMLVDAHGWPGVSQVGREGCEWAWIIAQHSICTPALQRGFLRAMEQAALVGEVPLKQVAMLTDRIRFNEGRCQVYGTVTDWDADGELNCNVEDRETVDARRAAVGLGPLAESLAAQRRAVTAEGGAPPEDLRAYHAAAERWAVAVGWR